MSKQMSPRNQLRLNHVNWYIYADIYIFGTTNIETTRSEKRQEVLWIVCETVVFSARDTSRRKMSNRYR